MNGMPRCTTGSRIRNWSGGGSFWRRSNCAAMKPGGGLTAQCGGGANLLRLRTRAQSLMRSPRFEAYFREWNEPWEYPYPQVTAERLRGAGFTEIETSLHAETPVFETADEF